VSSKDAPRSRSAFLQHQQRLLSQAETEILLGRGYWRIWHIFL
jgi:hypothetical protein